MKVVNSLENQVAFNYKRQADQLEKDAGNSFAQKNGDPRDEVTVTAKSAFDHSFAPGEIEGNKGLDMVGGIAEQIKENSLTASRSYVELDPKMVLSLFQD